MRRDHARAFAVAQAMPAPQLHQLRAAVEAAIAEGDTLQQFRQRVRPITSREVRS